MVLVGILGQGGGLLASLGRRLGVYLGKWSFRGRGFRLRLEKLLRFTRRFFIGLNLDRIFSIAGYAFSEKSASRVNMVLIKSENG